MSDLQSIIDSNLTEIVEKTIVSVGLCAALKKRGLAGTPEYQKLTKYQKDENHAEGAQYIYKTIVPTLDKAGETSFVEVLKEAKLAKVVEILTREGFVMVDDNGHQESRAFTGAEITDVKSAVKNNLREIVKNTKITVELCHELNDRNLVQPSEYEKLENYQRNGQHTEGASYLHKSILPKFDGSQQKQLVEALAAAGNVEAVNSMRPNQPGGTKKELESNWNETDGLACWTKKNPNRRFALIVNVHRGRPGVEVDEVRLSETLKECGFDVEIVQKQNRTKKNLVEEVKKFRDKVSGEKKPVDGIFVALMSHGHDNTMFKTEDGKSISIEEVIEMFSSEKCLSLENVPKVFLINMCRAISITKKDSENPDETQNPFNWEEYWNRLFENSMCKVNQEAHVAKDEFDSKSNPTWKTFYFGFSTQEGTYSYRYESSTGNELSELIGAWFVIDFCDVVGNKIRKGEPTPIATIFEEAKTRVVNRAEKAGLKGEQTPIHYSVAFDDHKKFQLPKP